LQRFLSISINIKSAEAVFLQNCSQIINLLQTNKQFVITIWQPLHIKILGFDGGLRTVTEGSLLAKHFFRDLFAL
jgi:hypothetical protein